MFHALGSGAVVSPSAAVARITARLLNWSLPGQVAQSVERSPEKAGVGGSIPSLATIVFNHLHGFLSPPWFHLVPKSYCSNVGKGSFSTARLRDSGMS